MSGQHTRIQSTLSDATIRSTSVFRRLHGQAAIFAWYDQQRAALPIATDSSLIGTSVGPTHVLVAGAAEAPPLVLLHGMNMNGVAMKEALVRLSSTHRVYALDIIGMPGKSAEVRLTRSGDAYARWLVEVLDGLGLATAAFLGLSFGGWIVLQVAALAPTRITKAILLDTGGLTQFTIRGQVMAGLLALPYMCHPSERNLRRAAITPFFGPGLTPDPDFVTLLGLGYRHVRLDVDVHGLPLVSAAQLSRFHAPTLVLYGEHDAFFDVAKSIERAQQIIPNVAEAKIIGGEGHMLSVEGSPAVYASIADFLG